MENDYRFNYKKRYPLDEGEVLAFADHDWTIRPVGDKFLVMANGEVPKRAATLEESFEILNDIVS